MNNDEVPSLRLELSEPPARPERHEGPAGGRPRTPTASEGPSVQTLRKRAPMSEGTPRPRISSRAAVVPAGASFRGRLSAEAVEIRGLVAGEVVCGFGTLVIHDLGGLEGRATAKGDVRVAGVVSPGAALDAELISTPGRLVLLPGARVRGDVRCGAIEIHEGATLQGVARGHSEAVVKPPCDVPS